MKQENNDTINDYIEFVQEQIENFKQSTRLISGDQIQPQTLNRALGEYGNVSAMLIAEYQRAKADHYRIDAEFTDWWDGVVSEAREEILASIEGKKYPAYKEYELVAKEKYRLTYRKYQDAIYSADERVSFLRRLIETFKKQDQILVNLSQNMRSELRALSLQDRMNAEPSPSPQRARRTVKTKSEEE